MLKDKRQTLNKFTPNKGIKASQTYDTSIDFHHTVLEKVKKDSEA